MPATRWVGAAIHQVQQRENGASGNKVFNSCAYQ